MCALPTNTAMKKPSTMVRSTPVIQGGMTDASMTFLRCIFLVTRSHFNRDSAIFSVLCSEPVPAMGDHPAL